MTLQLTIEFKLILIPNLHRLNQMNSATLKQKKVKVYRMLTPEHECPWGVKTVNLLQEKGIEFEDHKLRSCFARRCAIA